MARVAPAGIPYAWTVFVDGACQGNPGPGGWAAAVVSTEEGRVVELGGAEPATTNNRMELHAPIAALRWLGRRPGDVAIYSDSKYVVTGITQWVYGWRRRDWKTSTGTAVLNRDQWEDLVGLVERRRDCGRIAWHHVRGHSGIPGNERVDSIATAFSQGKRPRLYVGPLIRYEVAILDLPDPSEPTSRPARPPAPKAQAYSYLSLVDGVLQRHASWPECNARVHGRSGARFKKATSAVDEERIVSAWKLSRADLEKLRGS
jgi:ribonuclease HI